MFLRQINPEYFNLTEGKLKFTFDKMKPELVYLDG